VLRIYHASFDRAYREPDERLRQELRGEYRLPFRFLLAEEGGEILGFARFCRVREEGFGFLIHIAVAEGSRGRGIGTALLQRVVAEAGPIVAEIDREGPVRRWYERNGFSALSETYTQPALHPDTVPVGFCLSISNWPEPARSSESIVCAFYRSVWELESEHPFVREALQGVAA
jgi:GNAT superfamily N-acetyltransferase